MLTSGIDLSNTGIPTQSQLWVMYSQSSVTLLSHHEINSCRSFYLAFLFFKNCVIVQGVAQRLASGVASSSKADKVASLLPLMIELVESFLAEQEAGKDQSTNLLGGVENEASLLQKPLHSRL